jgi:hypothetical protein
MKHDKLSIISGLLVAAIGALAFILSFEAIRQLASDNGVVMAWIVPLIVDGAMIVFSVSVLRATLAGERVLWGWCLIVAFTAVSVWFNIEHSNGQVIGVAIAALAPLALFTTFETLMSQIRSGVQGGINALAKHWQRRARTLARLARDWRQLARERMKQLADLQAANEALTARLGNLQERVNELKPLQSENNKLQKENGRLQRELETMQEVYEIWQHMNDKHKAAARYNAGLLATLQDAAIVANVSESTISRIAGQMNGAGK